MRLSAHILWIVLPLAACGTTQPVKTHPYAEANDLMRREIETRIQNIAYQSNQELINNMMWLAGKAGETAIPSLLDGLKHDNPKVRSSCCWVLGRIRDRRTIPALEPLAKDKHESVRLEAARSLVVMGSLKHAPQLIEGLDSERVAVRYNCHMALKDATSRDFQYDHLEEGERDRRMAVLKWRTWYAGYSQDPWFAERYAQAHGLKPDSSKGIPAAPIGETRKPDADTGSNETNKGSTEEGSEQQGETEESEVPVIIPVESEGSEKPGKRETTEKK